MVYDYDLFNVSATGIGTTQTAINYYGLEGETLPVKSNNSYQVKIHTMGITNTGTASGIISIVWYDSSTDTSTTIYEVSLGAGASIILDGSKFDLVIPRNKELQAKASASTFDIFGTCYFSKL